MNTVTEPKTLDQAQRIYTLTEFIKRIRIKTNAGESIEPELAQAMHYINEDHDSEWEQRWPNSETLAYAELQKVVSARNAECSDLDARCIDLSGRITELQAENERLRRENIGIASDYALCKSQLAAANEKVPEGPSHRDLIANLQSFLDRVIKHSSDGTIHPELYEADADTLRLAISEFRRYGRAHKCATPLAPIAEQQWKPIETAPKDGSNVLLIDTHCKNPTAGVSHFADGKWIGCDSDVYQDIGKPDPWSIGVYQTPTHWQPLPAPPSDSLGGQG